VTDYPIARSLRVLFPEYDCAKDAADLIEEMAAALQPFEEALDGESYENCSGDIWESGAAMYLEFDDLRRAVAVLKKLRGE
jgi:hypothetical protein